MFKMKGTKRSLLMSALALLLCVSMLIGSTFAWFTDSVTSAGNIIKSGTLEISMKWADGKEAPATASWKNAADGAIFNYDKWEPGYTEARHIAVKNEGTLALKYQLTIVPTGEVSKLADVIDVYYIETATQLDERADLSAYTPVGTLTQLINNEISAVDVMPNGKLAAGEGFVATLVLKMRESAGNEYQDLSIGTSFSVQLLATQFTSEEDSYDENYDGGASWLGDASIGWYLEGLENDSDEFVIGSAEDLAGLAALVNGTATSNIATYAATAPTTIQDGFAGKTIMLASNIDLAGKAWTPIGNWDNAFEGTFDGQGYTISNLYINDAEGEGVGFFGVVAGATIKGLTLENVDVKGYSMVSALVGAAYPATISDCHVTGDISVVAEWAYVGGIAGYCYYGTQVDDCSVIADGTGVLKSETRNAVGGITAWLLEGDHSVTNCQVKNIDLIGWTNVGGITGFVHYSNTISGCSVENVNLVKTRVGGNPGIGLIAGGFSYSANNAITLSNNSVKNAALSGNHIAYSAYNVLYGSEYDGATTTNFVLENNTQESITNNLFCADSVKNVATVEELQNALNATGDVYINVTDDITGDMVAAQKPDTEVYINGNGHAFAGVLLVDGKSGTYTTAGLTIENVVFKADSISADACIQLGKDNNTRYTCNVTISNCTFDVPGAVGIKSYTGGDKNLKVIGCTATERAHSLMQAKGIDGILIEDCVVNSVRGANFNNSTNVTVVESAFDVQKYAVRFGEGSAATGDAEAYRIENCTLKSANVDNDAAVVLRGTADKSTLTIVNTTIVGGIDNSAVDATVIQ